MLRVGPKRVYSPNYRAQQQACCWKNFKILVFALVLVLCGFFYGLFSGPGKYVKLKAESDTIPVVVKHGHLTDTDTEKPQEIRIEETEVGVLATEKDDKRWTICVMTMDRHWSLKRLLESFLNVDFLGKTVDLIVSVDVRDGRKADKQTVSVSNQFTWPFGEYLTHIHTSNQGLLNQWLSACGRINDENDYTFIFEDDIEVSPEFFKYTQNVVDTYFHMDNVMGFSLQRLTLIPTTEGKFSRNNGLSPIASLLIGSVGHLPKPLEWIKFREWTREQVRQKVNPRVPGIVMDHWYQVRRRKNKAHTMWTIWHIKYCDVNKFFTVYSNLESDHGLAVQWSESGLNFKDSHPKRRGTVATSKTKGLDNFPPSLDFIGWDGKPF